MAPLLHILAMVLREQRGVTALEYGLITALIGGVIIVCVHSLGDNLTSAYTTIGGALPTEAANAAAAH